MITFASVGLGVLCSSVAGAAVTDESSLPIAGPVVATPLTQDDEAVDDEGAATTTGPSHDRVALMEVNFRYRRLSVPDSILDIWYFDEDDDGANPFERPRAHAQAMGLEYVIKPGSSNWILYYEYAQGLMDAGYWDDVEEPASHDDGDWVEPVGLGMHVLGSNYAHEVTLTSAENSVWLSMLFGAGLGVSFITGELRTWHPGASTGNTSGCAPTSPAYDRVDLCESDDVKRIPGVLPMVDISASARINFANRGNIRIDGGLHTMLYWGVAGGVVF